MIISLERELESQYEIPSIIGEPSRVYELRFKKGYRFDDKSNKVVSAPDASGECLKGRLAGTGAFFHYSFGFIPKEGCEGIVVMYNCIHSIILL